MTANEALGLLGLEGPGSPEAVAEAFRATLAKARPDKAAFNKVIEAYGLVQRLNRPRPEAAPDGDVLDAEREVKDILNISINEALNGVKRRIKLPDGSRAAASLPAGLRTGEVIRLKRPGDTDAFLKVRVAVEPHRSVEGNDLKLTVAVDRRVLDHGGRLSIETRDGPKTLWVRSTFAEGEVLRLKGKGLPERGEQPAGDLLIRPVAVEDPGPSAARLKLERFATSWAA
ncbi:MAG TPA: DnaJ C-terminal domain-containing protein [Caulobacteraceae bacterium]|nr:DnaJ C-terminal domain-containing protein [Caulobacteraceae bacterium]